MIRCNMLMLVSLLACGGSGAPSSPVREVTPIPLARGQTVVTLGFDDAFANQLQVVPLLAARGMKATFFVNSGFVGQAGHMTWAQLRSLADAGHEIGGHTVDHLDLATLSSSAATDEICEDRKALVAKGYDPTSFAYPFGSANPQAKSIAQSCGYSSARTVGSLYGRYAEEFPPIDPYYTGTPDSVKDTTSLATLESYVTQAEQHGGGWVQLVFHQVCTGCGSVYAIDPSTLSAFLDWLVPRAATGTIVLTTEQAFAVTMK